MIAVDYGIQDLDQDNFFAGRWCGDFKPLYHWPPGCVLRVGTVMRVMKILLSEGKAKGPLFERRGIEAQNGPLIS
jgi:hypothetical protein